MTLSFVLANCLGLEYLGWQVWESIEIGNEHFHPDPFARYQLLYRGLVLLSIKSTVGR